MAMAITPIHTVGFIDLDMIILIVLKEKMEPSPLYLHLLLFIWFTRRCVERNITVVCQEMRQSSLLS